MDIALKIVTRLPLQELWRGSDFTTTARGRWLSKDAIADLLRAGLVQFVVVDLGSAPRWITLGDCCDFWKCEAKPHLADTTLRFRREDFPGEYFCLASQWESESGAAPIVVLERYH